jgi:cytochrome c oxidase subunit 3
MKLGLLQVIVGMIGWWRDVINESFQYNTAVVQRGLRLGFFWVIVSEGMFLFGVFWGFFHSSLAPSIFIGGI